MKFMSFFSGIEAASVAWEPLGWECASVSEIDEFASAVLAHRFPTVPNLGDITKVSKEKLNELKGKHNGIDLVIGGSPCQSFSIAGLRKGLEDPRGNLMLEYARIVNTIRPRWFIWENVVGALSTNGGRDFGTLLTTMAKFGYRLQWRVLDAQFFGVAQRRRRVFLVGYLGNKENWERVLFEPNCGKGNHQASENEWGFDSPETESSLDGDYQERELSLSDMLFGGGESVEESPKNEPTENPTEEKTFVMPSRWHYDESAFSSVSPTLTTKGSVRIVEDKSLWVLPSTQPNATQKRFRKTNVAPTLVAAMGAGGGHIPSVLEEKKPIWIMANKHTGGIKGFGLSNVSPCLLAGMGMGGGIVPMFIEEEKPQVFITRGDNWGAISCGRYDHVAPTLVCFNGCRPLIIDDKATKPQPIVMAGTAPHAIENAKPSNVAPTLCTFVGQKPMIVEENKNLFFQSNSSSGSQYIRSLNKARTLLAGMSKGDTKIPILVEQDLFHSNYRSMPPQHHTKCPTLMAAMGGGGGHVPLIVTTFYHSNYSSYKQLETPTEKASTLMAAMGKEPRMVPMILESDILAQVVQPKENLVQTPISLYNGAVNTDVFHTLTAATAINASGPRLLESTGYRNRIRKLTEIECERLQGFPDNWTKIPYKGKPKEKCPKSPRYKCLGNSMAVPVIEWIGSRIEKFENDLLT